MGDRRVEVAPEEVPQFEVRAYVLIGDVEIMDPRHRDDAPSPCLLYPRWTGVGSR